MSDVVESMPVETKHGQVHRVGLARQREPTPPSQTQCPSEVTNAFLRLATGFSRRSGLPISAG